MAKYGFVKNEELQLKRKDGSPFFGSVSAVAITDKAGEVLYYDGIIEDITDRRRMQEALQEQKERAQQYLDMAGVMLLVIGADQRVQLINKRGCDLLGYSEEEIVGKNWFDNFVPEEQRNSIRGLFEKLMRREKEPETFYENFVLTRDGDKRMVLWHNTLLTDESGTPTGTLSSGEDITERIEAEKALRESEEKFRLSFENARDAILWADAMTGAIINCNKSAEVLFQRNRDELIGMHQTAIHPPDKAEYYTSMFQKHIDQNGFADDEAEILTKSGAVRLVTITASVTIVEGRPIIQGIFHDITERKRAEDELKVMATTDALTNVLNRGTGLLLFGKQLQMAKRNNMKLSLCYIDFNDLKDINDTYGHREGDEALKRVANYLRDVLRAIDIVCRLGGDEFLIVLPQCPLDNAQSVWQRIASHIEQFNESGIKPYKISLSHGFAEFDPAEEKTVDQLIATADQEMYKDKQSLGSKKPEK
jgi:diguanylate cyclase (GGDEF)-like protein/PAS domain S-box-containing protein